MSAPSRGPATVAGEAASQAAWRLQAPLGFVLRPAGESPVVSGHAEPFDVSELEALRAALGQALGPGGHSTSIRNTLEDPRLAASPLMRRRGVQFLAAEPCGDGGALCVADYRPRAWPEQDRRLLATWARIVFQGAKALDPGTGGYLEASFRPLCEAESGEGRPRGLVLCDLIAYPEVSRERGAETAERLLGRLAATLGSRVREHDLIGRLPGGRLALWLAVTPTGLEAVVRKLNEAIRTDFRFPVRVAAAAGRPSFQETLTAAEAGLVESKRPRTARGQPAWEQRYQRLILLHRVAVRLFASQGFHEALGEAGDVILGLAGARRLSIQRVEPPGVLVELLRRGGRGPAQARLEAEAIEEAQRGAAAWRADAESGWLAVPIPALHKEEAPCGVLALGYDETEGPDAEARELLGEVGLLLRNAFGAHLQLREQRLLAAVTEQSADPVIMTDLQGRVTAWSRGAETLFGWTAKEALGGKLNELIVPEDQAEASTKLTTEALDLGVARADDVVRTAKDGRRIPVAQTVTLVRDEDGNPFGMVRILRDITRIKELDRMKSEFVQLVTHELRTPMTSVRGFAEALLEYGDKINAEEARRYLEIILREAKRLSRLVTDFLDASRLEAGSSALEKKPVDVVELSKRVATTFEGHRAGVEFRVDAESGLPRLLADEDKLERVLINLCGNAVKYSPKGGVITIAARRLDGKLQLSVADQGPGMGEETQARLFQKFYRANDAVAAKTHGTGLGLYIAKAIVEAHGGRINVESRPGHGARMVIELPVDAT